MSRNKIGLGQAIIEIQEKVEEIIEQETKEGGRLEDVSSVISWVHHRGAVRHPAIWIIPQEPIRESRSTGNIRRGWKQTFSIASLVKSNDPKEGARQATLLAGICNDILSESKNLGLPFVKEIDGINFSPSNNSNSNGAEFGAVAFLDVYFYTN